MLNETLSCVYHTTHPPRMHAFEMHYELVTSEWLAQDRKNGITLAIYAVG
jgi:hypothetical protein